MDQMGTANRNLVGNVDFSTGQTTANSGNVGGSRQRKRNQAISFVRSSPFDKFTARDAEDYLLCTKNRRKNNSCIIFRNLLAFILLDPFSYFYEKVLSANDHSQLGGFRHPNILQFLGSLIHDGQMILRIEHLSRGGLHDILSNKIVLDIPLVLRFALDIARNLCDAVTLHIMTFYEHHHKLCLIIHNHLDLKNLLQEEGGHLKIGEYCVQMLYGLAPNHGYVSYHLHGALIIFIVDGRNKVTSWTRYISYLLGLLVRSQCFIQIPLLMIRLTFPFSFMTSSSKAS